MTRGSPTIGGPVITKSGLIFIGASMDNRVRAIDCRVPTCSARPGRCARRRAACRLSYKGRENVAFVAGGNWIVKPQVGDQIVAFALP